MSGGALLTVSAVRHWQSDSSHFCRVRCSALVPLHEARQVELMVCRVFCQGLLPIRARNQTPCSGPCMAFTRECFWCLWPHSMPAQYIMPLLEDGM